MEHEWNQDSQRARYHPHNVAGTQLHASAPISLCLLDGGRHHAGGIKVGVPRHRVVHHFLPARFARRNSFVFSFREPKRA